MCVLQAKVAVYQPSRLHRISMRSLRSLCVVVRRERQKLLGNTYGAYYESVRTLEMGEKRDARYHCASRTVRVISVNFWLVAHVNGSYFQDRLSCQ